MSEQEEWRPVLGFPDYWVSNLGRILSTKSGTARRVSTPVKSDGYRGLSLYRDGQRHYGRVHVLVAEAFHGARPPGLMVRHLDGDQFNNSAENLRWGTASENQLDTIRHRRHNQAEKTECVNGHPFDAVNTRLYGRVARAGRPQRVCRSCEIDRERRRPARQRTAA